MREVKRAPVGPGFRAFPGQTGPVPAVARVRTSDLYPGVRRVGSRDRAQTFPGNIPALALVKIEPSRIESKCASFQFRALARDLRECRRAHG